MSNEKKIYPQGSGQFGPPDTARSGRVEFDNDDLSKATKATLKDYLSNLTHSRKNAFPISHASLVDPKTNEKQSLDSEIDIHANSEDKVAEIRVDTNENQFISLAEDSSEANNLRSYSDSGLFTDLEVRSATLKTFFDKNQRGQGHNLLRDIKHSRDYDNHALTEPTGRDKKEIFTIEFILGKPIVYLTNLKEKPDLLCIARLNCLYIIKNKDDYDITQEEDQIRLKEILKKRTKRLRLRKKYIENREKQIKVDKKILDEDTQEEFEFKDLINVTC